MNCWTAARSTSGPSAPNQLDRSFPTETEQLLGNTGRTLQGSLSSARMAHGGIVDRPTLLLAGERGPEEVRPVGQGGRGEPVEVHVFNTAVMDPGELMARGVARGGAPVRFLTTFHEPRNLIEKNTLRNQTRR